MAEGNGRWAKIADALAVAAFLAGGSALVALAQVKAEVESHIKQPAHAQTAAAVSQLENFTAAQREVNKKIDANAEQLRHIDDQLDDVEKLLIELKHQRRGDS